MTFQGILDMLIYESMCCAKIQGKLLKPFSIFWNCTNMQHSCIVYKVGLSYRELILFAVVRKLVDFMSHTPGFLGSC